MEYGIQIASSIIMIGLLFSFIKEKHLPLISTRFFIIYLILVAFNMVFEWGTLMTLRYLPWDSFLNRFMHQLFLGSLNLSIFSLYLYVDLKSRINKRYTPLQLLIRIIPLIISLGFVIFAPINYTTGPHGVSYSYGVMVIPVYCMTIIYSLLIIMIALFRKNLSLQSKITIFSGVASWLSIAIVQFIFPEALLTSCGLTLMTLLVIFSIENNHDYLDFEIKNSLNHYALGEILSELYAKKKEFYVINYVVRDSNHDIVNDTLNSISNEYLKYPTYIAHEGVVSVIFTVKDIYLLNLNELEKKSSNDLLYFVSTIECPKYAENKELFNEYIEYIAHKFNTKKFINTFDDSEIKKMNYNSTLEHILKDAITNDGFNIVYQPIYSTKDKKFKSAEALIRLNDTKTLGFVSPEIFIPVAEGAGLIEEIGNIVFEKVCKFFNENKLYDLGIEYIEINVSGIQATNLELPNSFNKILDKYKLSPKYINLEITETASVTSNAKLDINMKQFRDYGYRFSMDDFGTGYSNFKKMADTRFELIKIDKSLIWPCFDIKNDRKRFSINVLTECIHLIHSIDSMIVAEGVETKEMLDFLASLGVEYIQGYYFSKPLNGEDYLNFIKKYNL